MLPRGTDYDDIRRNFRWEIPARFNIGVAACDRWADDADRIALIHRRNDGGVDRYGFRDLKLASNRLANALAAHGIGRGDRVAILLPQVPETAIAHIAAYKLGAIAVPLFTLFQADALRYRLGDSGAAALITDAANLPKIEALQGDLPDLRIVVAVGAASGSAGLVDWTETLARASDRFDPAATEADDPALIIYTSGTTGPPKGALHAHRTLLGHLPGVEMPHEFFPQPGDLFWTPADWAWIGGLIDVLLPSLYHGVPVLAHRMEKFDPELAFALMAENGVRNVFMPPTALKLMRQVDRPRERWRYDVRSVGSGGETLGAELLDWGRATFGLTINEFYGQTECNLVVGNCAGVMAARPGWMGRAIPGHEVAVIDGDGMPLPPGAQGDIAIRAPDPVMFLGYWNNPDATAAKFRGDWLVTGDIGIQDDDGYFRFVARDDDVITSAGYRIGPGEVEDCLLKHPAVTLAAAVGVPDPVRTQIVKAFIVLKSGQTPTDALAAEIGAFVKTTLAAHEYPRAIEFVDSLPMTATGKIRRRDLREKETG